MLARILIIRAHRHGCLQVALVIYLSSLYRLSEALSASIPPPFCRIRFIPSLLSMERIRRIFERELSDASYEPLEGGSERPDGERIEHSKQEPFSWIDYSVFVLLGVAMLWAW